MADIYIHYGTDLTGITYEIMAAAGIADRLRPEMTVGIKPNLVVVKASDIAAMIRQLRL